MAKREIGFALAFLVLLTATPAAQAQFAVIDVASVTQLMSQVRTLEQQLATARNYLPPSWESLESTLQGTGAAYPLLSKELGRALADVSVLSPAQMAALS